MDRVWQPENWGGRYMIVIIVTQAIRRRRRKGKVMIKWDFWEFWIKVKNCLKVRRKN